MPDPHTLLVASLTARLERARAATPGPWHTPGPDTVGQWVIYDSDWAVAEVRAYSHNDPMSNKPGARGPAYIDSDANATFIVGCDPATEIRRVEALLRVVERHRPVAASPADSTTGYVCMHCELWTNDSPLCREWPCDDFRDLASGEGIEVET